MKEARIAALSLAIIACGGVLAQTPVQLQQIGWMGSARSLGMGGAFTGMVNDEACLIHNPAGLALLDARVAGASTMVNVERTKFSQFLYIEPPTEEAMGGGFGFFSTENKAIGLKDETICYTLSQRYDPHLSIGLTVKYNTRTLAGAKDRVWSFDLGAVYQLDPQTVIGASVININEPAVLGHRLWRQINIGAAYQYDPNTVVTLDIFDATDRVTRQLRLGVERYVTPTLCFRLGTMGRNFTFGIGYTTGAWKIDFGYVHNKDLPIVDDINIFSISTRF